MESFYDVNVTVKVRCVIDENLPDDEAEEKVDETINHVINCCIGSENEVAEYTINSYSRSKYGRI